MLLRVTDAVHRIVAGVLETGDLAIDATAGNGLDTAFLAAEVGGSGRVVAFDVQEIALRSTAERLERLDLLDRVDLIRASHARMAEHVDPASCRAGVVMFNLGYLPGGADRSTRTRPPGTTAAIRAAMELLRPEGLVSVVCYRGHDGGAEESEAVMKLVDSVDPKRYAVSTYRVESAGETAPFAVFIQHTA